MTMHGDQVKTPYDLYSSRQSDLSRLRTFGCHVYVGPLRHRRPAKSEIDARTYVFLGYAQTLKNLLLVDVDPLGLLHLLLFGLDSEIAGGGQLVSGHGATGL
jgi:hypothetical protein